MSFFQNPSFYIQTAETDIVAFFKNAEAEVTVIEQDFLNALNWVQSNGSEIAMFVAGLLGVVASVSGGQIPAALISAQAALNTGIQLINSAVAGAQASGGSVNSQTVAALSAAYAQFKNAQAAAATMASTTVTPASTPAAAQ